MTRQKIVERVRKNKGRDLQEQWGTAGGDQEQTTTVFPSEAGTMIWVTWT